jgi:spore maturation protein CgeB
MKITIVGLSITSSWGNGHATTYRGLVRELARLGHEVVFLERDVPWYAGNRDLPKPKYCKLILYKSLKELFSYKNDITGARLVIIGSYVPEGVAVARWILETAGGITAFYDIDTPVTLAKLASGDTEYLIPELIPLFDLYLSFTGGPVLRYLENHYGAKMARALYCSVDTELYKYQKTRPRWDLGYIGTYSKDRQASVERFLLEPALKLRDAHFVVAGPLYPKNIKWPANLEHIEHLPPGEHWKFYNSQRFTLNVTREDMIKAGYSPSVRLFEAAGCATPIISDYWEGLDTFFEPGKEILLAENSENIMDFLTSLPETERAEIGRRGQKRVLANHTAAHRAQELLSYLEEASSLTPQSASLDSSIFRRKL